jgi:hypothetical protein
VDRCSGPACVITRARARPRNIHELWRSGLYTIRPKAVVFVVMVALTVTTAAVGRKPTGLALPPGADLIAIECGFPLLADSDAAVVVMNVCAADRSCFLDECSGGARCRSTHALLPSARPRPPPPPPLLDLRSNSKEAETCREDGLSSRC